MFASISSIVLIDFFFIFFIYPHRTTRPSNRPTLLTVSGRLSGLVARAEVPAALGVLLSSCQITELNKVSEEQQVLNVADGKGRQTRPLACGSNTLKLALAAAKRTPEGRRAIAGLGPTQIAVGKANGPAIMAATANLAFKRDMLCKQDDRVSGFQTLGRQSMHDGVSDHFPEAVSLMNLVYRVPAPVFFLYFDKVLNEWVCDVIWSSEGPRQGCTWGNLLYCFACLTTIRFLSRRYPSVLYMAQIDDFAKYFPLPSDTSPEGWDNYFAFICAVMMMEDEIFNAIGQFRHPGKCTAVLPDGC